VELDILREFAQHGMVIDTFSLEVELSLAKSVHPPINEGVMDTVNYLLQILETTAACDVDDGIQLLTGMEVDGDDDLPDVVPE
jgi:hypothetical protein